MKKIVIILLVLVVLAGGVAMVLVWKPWEEQKITASAERIDQSVYRILEFKEKYLTNYTYLDASYFGSEEHRAAVDLSE